jgi:16S rRNA (uracil1498-N3)-methyltransferase
MQLFYHFPIENDTFNLGPEESKHMVKVLRKNVGDSIHFTDGEGNLYFCRVTEISQKSTSLKVLEKSSSPKTAHSIHLAIAPTKNADRMEWLVEKAVEIGLDELILMNTANSERNFLKPERLEKKSISAMKQSLKTYRTQIRETIPFEELIQDEKWKDFEKFIAYVDHTIPNHLLNLAGKNQKYLVLIGPEGDFSPEEISLARKHGFKPCSLGKSRLRTETAGLVAVHTLNLLNE